MSARQDFVALDWIKGEISQTLDQAQHALEAVAESPDDASSMRACLTHLHQVHGTLRMVELLGPTQLSGEMEELAQALLSDEVPDIPRAQEMLMQAILQMPGYLDRIQRDQRDMPEVIRPIVNGLRLARGAEKLAGTPAEPEGFNLTGFSALPAAAVLTAFAAAGGESTLKKLRSRYQQSLVALLKKEDARENLTLLAKVFSMVVRICGESPLGNLGWLGLATVEGVAAGALKFDNAAARNLKQIDAQFKATIEGGLATEVPETLAEELLARLDAATREIPRVTQTLLRFTGDVSGTLEDEEDVSFGPDDETLAAVATILIEELTSITDKLDLYVRSTNRRVDSLTELLPQLEQIKGTLSLVGLAQHQTSVTRQVEVIRGIERSGDLPDDEVLLEMAGSLLGIEAALKSLVGESEDGESDGLGSVSDAEATVIRETRNGLAQCKDALIEFVTADFDTDRVQDLPATLRSLRGGLSMVNQPRCAAVLVSCADYVEQRLIKADEPPTLAAMDDLADAITSIDYFLERLLESTSDPYLQMIEVAESAITKLGFAPGGGVVAAKNMDKPQAAPVESSDDEPNIPAAAEALPAETGDEAELAENTLAVEPGQEPTIGPGESAEAEAALAADTEESPADPVPAPAVDETRQEPDAAPSVAESAEESLIDDEILEIFIEEAAEVIETLGEFFPQWKSNPADEAARTEVRRAFHTLKGSGRMVGATVVGELAWAIENMLNRVIDGSVEVSETMFVLIEEVITRVPDGVAAFRDGHQESFDTTALVARAEAIVSGESTAPEPDVEPPGEAAPEETFESPGAASVAPTVESEMQSSLDVEAEETGTGFEADAGTEKPENLSPDESRLDAEISDAEMPEEDALEFESLDSFDAESVEAELEATEPDLEPGLPDAMVPEEDAFEFESLDSFDAESVEAEAEAAEPDLEPGLPDTVVPEEDALEFESLDSFDAESVEAEAEATEPDLEPGLPDTMVPEEDALEFESLDSFDAESVEAELEATEPDLEPGLPDAMVPEEDAFEFESLDSFDAESVEAEAEAAEPDLEPGLPDTVVPEEDALEFESLDSFDAESVEAEAEATEPDLEPGLPDTMVPEEDAFEFESLDSFDTGPVEAGIDTETDAETETPPTTTPPEESEYLADTVEGTELEEITFESLDDFSAEPDEQSPVSSEADFVETDDELGLTSAEDEADAAGIELEELEELDFELSDPQAAADSDSELDGIFLEEAADRMAVVREFVADPRKISSDLVAAFHTLKGSGGMAEVNSVAKIAAPLEMLSNRFAGTETVPASFVALVQRGAHLIDEVLADLSAHRYDMLGIDEFVAEAGNLDSHASTLAEVLPAFDFRNIRILCTAEEVLAGWDEEQLDALKQELKEVAAQALQIRQDGLHRLAEALLAVYESGSSPPEPEVASVLAGAHEQLVSMFDHIASSQDVPPADDTVALLASLRLAPARVDEAAADVADELPGVTDASQPTEPMVEPEAAATGAEALLPADEVDEDVLPLFLEEAEELLENIDQSIVDWSAEPGNEAPLGMLLRHLHTLKGGARMSGLASLGEFTHNFETFLIGIQNNPVPLDEAFFALVNQRQDEIIRRIGIYGRLAEGAASAEELASMRHDQAPSPATAVASASTAPLVHEEPVEASSDEIELPSDEMDEDILPVFLEEAEELVEAIDESVTQWDADPDDLSHLDNLLRQLHTLKGGSRMSGLASLGEFAHNVETYLIGIQNHPVNLGEDFFALLNGLQDEINRRVTIYQKAAQGEATEAELASMRTMRVPGQSVSTRSVQADQPPVTAPESTPPLEAEATKEPAQAHQAPQEMVRVSSDLLEELIGLAGESSITRGRVEQQIADFVEALQEMDETINRIRDQVRRLEIEAESRETVFRTRWAEEDEESGFDDLEMDRYSMLQEISRALSEGSSDMMDLKDTLLNKSRDAETLLHQQARISSELQEGLTRTRMVPFARLIPRLRRIVRQISAEVGKSVRFDAYNVEGELDRNVLERIVAPLEHMLRNAVDHGIEDAARRAAAGKPEQGRISLRLSREGGYVVLKISDDGGGINVDAVKAKAIERGLITSDSVVSDHEVRQFILNAGFSTAAKVTQISGRGVGMDVVVNEIKALGGTVEIDSTFGVGTEFTIQLPFTVSINRALMVVVQDEIYAVPLNTIEGIVRVSPYELEAYYQPDAPMFEYAGQPYRLVYMGRMLDKGELPMLEGQVAPLPVILARSGDNAVAMQVDRVIGSREVVVKSLGPQFNEVGGVSGATVLGDGSVVVILDVMALVRSADMRSAGSADTTEVAPEAQVHTVMIVDDSVTVRKVTSRLMERQGWEVITAKDGVDAMNQLQDVYPDIVLLDIEMPRMDGFEVLRAVRRDERLKDLPIIMITSRTGEKHQQQALELGVNRYLGKPFQEVNLLSTIDEVLAETRDR
ncbi:MAG: Hpt domain-containing protein [Pseudomonadota bacterium]